MKYIKKYRYIFIVLALILAVIPFCVHADDDSDFDISGWHDESCHNAVKSVKINGVNLSEYNMNMYDSVDEVNTVKAEASDTVNVEITLENGYALSADNGSRIYLSGVQSESDHITASSNAATIKVPSAEWRERDKELYLSFKTERKPGSGGKITTVNNVVLNIGSKINCQTKVDVDNYIPDVSVPSGKGYRIVPDSICLVRKDGASYTDYGLSPFVAEKNRSAIFKVDIIDRSSYVFNDNLKKSDITVKNGKVLDLDMISIGGSSPKSKAHELCLTVSVDIDHKWDAGKVTRKATYKKAGVKTYTCRLCKATKTESIPKLNNTMIVRLKAKGKSSLVLTWNKIDGVDGADGYDIFFTRCDGKSSTAKKKIKTLKGNKTLSWTVKGLKKHTAYKAFVKAWKLINGKKKYVSKGMSLHAYTSGGSKKYTNPKSLKINKKNLILKKGKTFKIKGKVTKLNKKKILIQKGHAATLRYLSTDKKIATVSRTGKIKAVGKGKCKIYVVTVNGLYKSISLTVK